MAAPVRDDAGEGYGSASPRWRRWLTHRGTWAVLLLLVAGLYAGGLAVAGARDAFDAVSTADLWPLVGALLLQVVVTATWPMVHRASVSAVGEELSYGRALNVSMSAFTVSHTVPGGGAVGAAVVVERLTGFGLPGPAAAATTTLTGPLTLTTISSLGVLGLGGAAVTGELPNLWLLVGLLLLLVLVLVQAGIVVGLRSPRFGERLITVVGRLHHRLAHRAAGWRESWRRITRQEVSTRHLAPIVGWSAVKWTADIGSLALVFVAFGHEPRLIVLLVGFAAAQVGAAVPLTPGGVGFVEGGMIAVFTALGVALPVATSVVLVYRVVETWLPTLAGIPMLLRAPGGSSTSSGRGGRARGPDGGHADGQ